MKVEIVFKDGRKETFDNVVSLNVTEEHRKRKKIKRPEEGVRFEVNPQAIDRHLFQKERNDSGQEKARRLIQDAFAELDKCPEKYASQFYTLIPVKDWHGCKSVAELKRYAISLGGMMADWVQQALEWAQRISNGEAWEAICNDPDHANCYRAIIGQNEGVQLVGGMHCFAYKIPASDIDDEEYCFNAIFDETVPLVVIKKE